MGALAALVAQTPREYQSQFKVDKKTLGVKGSNPYFILTPGYTLSFAHRKDTEAIAVLNETKLIDGVVTRPVEDREMKNGQLVEVTRDYYAIDSATSDVYYFGEEVDTYKNGKVAGHEGAWFSGVNGAKFGLMMPGAPKQGQRFFQEQAPGVGMDRCEILGAGGWMETPAGTFNQTLHVVETSAIEAGLHDQKWYVSGVGLVKDEEMELVKYGGE